MRAHGIHANVPAHEYHERVLGVASKSALDLVNRSPAHYYQWATEGIADEAESSAALYFGAALHCALLEPGRFLETYAVRPKYDKRTKGGKAASDAWDSAHPGRIAISDEVSDRLAAMVRAVHGHPLAGKMIAAGEPELSAYWQDAETGLQCKMRTDYYVRARRMLVDVKTTSDARPEAFRKSVVNYGYHRQAAFYRTGFAACGEDVEYFAFIAIESAPPHAIAVYGLDIDALARGQASIEDDMQVLAECMQHNRWPGYLAEIQTLNLPKWAA